jgi:hypothetical protein
MHGQDARAPSPVGCAMRTLLSSSSYPRGCGLPKPSFRQGAPEPRHREVNRPTDSLFRAAPRGWPGRVPTAAYRPWPWIPAIPAGMTGRSVGWAGISCPTPPDRGKVGHEYRPNLREGERSAWERCLTIMGRLSLRKATGSKEFLFPFGINTKRNILFWNIRLLYSRHPSSRCTDRHRTGGADLAATARWCPRVRPLRRFENSLN